MFNLLVKYNPWGGVRDSVPLGRILEYTSDTVQLEFKTNGTINFDALSKLPCLFAEESTGAESQVARVGTIFRCELVGRQVNIEYGLDPGVAPIPQGLLRDLAGELEIGDFEFSRTHWAVKHADLFRSLLKSRNPRRQRPKVFQLPEFESIENNLVSVMMPFDAKIDSVYGVLRESVDAAGLRCRRADEIWENPAIIQDVVSLIDKSKVVICDCTGRNPNVFYEIGIAHTLGRDVILITQSDTDVPFDLRHLRYIKYANNADGLRTLKSQLESRLGEATLGARGA
ncbi:MAG: hypothetical protein ABSC62_00930 [Terracidiphilus sp.]